jgi:hypothetical protein
MIAAGELQLSTRGQPVAWQQSGDSLRFYAEVPESIYSDENVYWLTNSDAVIVSEIAADVIGGSPADSFSDSVHAEENIYAPNNSFKTVGDIWTWQYLIAGNAAVGTRDFAVDCPDPALAGGGVHPDSESLYSFGAELTLRIVGSTETDHRIAVSVNGTSIGEEQWSGMGRQTFVMEFDGLLMSNGVNTVTVQSIKEPDVAFAIEYLDSIDIRYARLYKARNNYLHFNSGNARDIKISGFSESSISLLEISNPNQPVLIGAAISRESDGSYSIECRLPHAGGEYAVFTDAAVSGPDSLAAVATKELESVVRTADMLIIAPQELMSGAQRLADYRRGRGWQVEVVGLEDIYNELNYGIIDPHAVRRMIAVALHNWQKAPRYLLLAGSGSYDYKDYSGAHDNLLPPMLVATAGGVQVSDAALADVSGNGLPDIAVGRIPARTAAELDDAVTKIINYESGGSWKTNVLMAADNADDGGEFSSDSEVLAGKVPAGYSVTKTYLGSNNTAEVHQQIMDSLSAGVAVFNYIGHAGITGLANENIFTADDIGGLSNSANAAIMLSASCDIAQFGIPGYPAMGEKMVVGTNGAAAVWSAIGGVYNRDSIRLSGGVFDSIFAAGTARIGDALMDSFEADSYGASLSDHYVLLGDPALAVGSPDAAPRSAVLSDTIAYSEWKLINFAPASVAAESGENSDPNGDGISNRMAYMLGISAGGAAESFAVHSALAGVGSGSGKLAELRIWKRRGASLNYRVKSCTDLRNPQWNDAVIDSVRAGRIDGTMEEVILGVSLPHNSKHSFMCVEVTE